MKRVIRQYTEEELEEIYGMSRIGWIPEGTENTIEVYVHTNDPGNIPHFHVRKYGRNNNYDWEVCIKFESAEYFSHGRYSGKLPNRKVAKQLDDMLRDINKSSRYQGTYWERAIDEWNMNNSQIQLPLDLEQPDYSKLS